MSDYEKVMLYLRERAEEVRGEWNGKLPGQAEDSAHAATELLELLDEVDSIVKELDL